MRSIRRLTGKQWGCAACRPSAQCRQFESRLYSTEPTGPVCVDELVGWVLGPIARAHVGFGGADGCASARRRRFAAVFAGAAWVLLFGLVATCLILTKSRSAYLAVLIGIGSLAVVRGVPRAWLRGRWLVPGALILVVGGLLATWLGGLDRQVLTEAPKSFLYRVEYWQGSLAMMAQHPWFGCGPGNFKEYYTLYKLPAASETVADPHNFLMEVGATAGLPALALLVWAGAVFVRHAWRLRGGVFTLLPPNADVPRPAGDSQRGLPGWKSVYGGAAAGCVMAYPSAWAGGQPPAAAMLWTVWPAMLLTLCVQHRWVIGGRLPVATLLVGAGTLLVNLLAAGGMGYPGVAGLLWVLVGLTLNVLGNGRRTRGGARATATAGARNAPWHDRPGDDSGFRTDRAGYVTFYRPVLAGHVFSAFLENAAGGHVLYRTGGAGLPGRSRGRSMVGRALEMLGGCGSPPMDGRSRFVPARRIQPGCGLCPAAKPSFEQS